MLCALGPTGPVPRESNRDALLKGQTGGPTVKSKVVVLDDPVA